MYFGFDGQCHELQERVSGCIITQLLALHVAVLVDFMHCNSYYYRIAGVAGYIITVLWCCLN